MAKHFGTDNFRGLELGFLQSLLVFLNCIRSMSRAMLKVADLPGYPSSFAASFCVGFQIQLKATVNIFEGAAGLAVSV
jgi:hypothetical protein